MALDHVAPVLMPRSRLIADITSPQNPIRLISSDRPNACSGVNG